MKVWLGKTDRSSFGSTHEVLLGVKIGKNIKDLEKKQEELFDGVRKNAAEITAEKERIDGLEEELDEVGNKVNENLDKINEAGSQIRDLDGKIDNSIKSISDLKDKVESEPASSLMLEKVGSVYFNVDSHELTAEAKARLDAMRAAINTPQNRFVVYVSGNASEEASSDYNFILSAKRAASVKQYLAGVRS